MQGINWAVVAIALSAVTFAVWLFLVVRLRSRPLQIIASIGFVLVACSMIAAPFRASVDHHYPGFAWGYIHAASGLPVVLTSAAIILSALVVARLLLSRMSKAAAALVAVISVAFLVNIGVPFLEGLTGDIRSNDIQFGQYLTVPGLIATPIIMLVELAPLLCALGLSLKALSAKSTT